MARDPYEVVLADLRAKRDEIDRLIQSLESFRTVGSSTAQSVSEPTPKTATANGPYTGMSIADAAGAALKAQGAPMGTAEIALAIQAGGLVMNSAEPTNTVSAVLHRALQNGNVKKLGRGRWGLSEWDAAPEVKTMTKPEPDFGADPPFIDDDIPF